MFAQKFGEFGGNVVGVDQFADLVDIDIADVILYIGTLEEFPLKLLLVLQGQQLLAEKRNQRQGPQTGGVFGFVLGITADFALAPFPVRCYRVGNGEDVVLEVKVMPLKPHDLTAAQPVEQPEINGQFQFGTFRQTHTFQSLLRRVETADELLCGGPLVMGCVVGDQLVLHSTLQRGMDVGVVSYHRGAFLAGDAVFRISNALCAIKLLQVFGFQLRQCDAFFLEIGVDMLFNRIAVAGIGDRVYIDLLAGKPGEHIVGKKHIPVWCSGGFPSGSSGGRAGRFALFWGGGW